MKSVREYLRDLTPYDVTEGAIDNALINAGVSGYWSVKDISLREREICSAWIYDWCAKTPSITSSRKDSDGGWSHEEGAKQVSEYDKRLMRQRADAIFRKYGLDAGTKSSIRLSAFGMRVFRH